MTDRPRTTVSYRLLVNPALGAGAGNTVHVGLDAQYGDQLAPLVFEGLPRRVEQIRDAIDSVLSTRSEIDTRQPTTPLDLRATMDSVEMRVFAPVLVKGQEIFSREEPLDPARFTAKWFARQLATLMLVDLGVPRGGHVLPDSSLEATLAFLLKAWKAWRADRDTAELAAELTPHLASEIAHHADRLQTEIARLPEQVIAWPRDADRIPAMVHAAITALDENTESAPLFDDLKRRLRR